MSWLRSLSSDLGQSWRTLVKRPGMSLAAVLTITLAIGAGSAVFSIVNAILLQPLPYKNPDRLVMVWNLNERAGYSYEMTKTRGDSMSPAEFLEWRESGIFEHAALFSASLMIISDENDPEMTHGYFLSEGGFEMLGVQPMLGRLPTREEQQMGAERVILLRHNLWQRRFQSDPSVLDTTIEMYGTRYRIIGVMPPGFVFFNRQSEILGPLQFTERMWRLRSTRAFRVMARLKDGMTLEEAQARAAQFSAELAKKYADTNAGWNVRLVPLAEDAAGELRGPLLALLGAVGFVLLIMGANLANLLLVHAAARGRELAIRSALGAGRARLARILMGESLILSVAGGTLGLGLAFAIVKAFQTALPDRNTHGKYLLQLESIRVDPWVIGFAFVAALAAGLLFGLIPALRASRPNFNVDLKETGRSSSGGLRTRGLHGALVVAEVAFSLVLVLGAALLVRSFAALYERGPGLLSDNLLTFIVQARVSEIMQELREQGVAPAEVDTRAREIVRGQEAELLRRIEAIPGVEHAAATTSLPMQGWFQTRRFTIEGRPVENEINAPGGLFATVTANYFQTMGIPLIQGRLFGPEDRSDAPLVCIVSDEVVRRYWPGEDPISKRLKLGPPDSRAPWQSVVGVVGSVRESGMREEPAAAIYGSHTQDPFGRAWMVVKAAGGSPQAMLPDIRRTIREIDAGMPIYRIREMREVVRDSAWQLNYSMALLTGLAALALLLAAIGLYGVLSYAVRQQTREIGVRMALGADRGRLLSMVLGNGLKLVALGLALGYLASAGLMRFLSALLFGVEAFDLPTFALAGAILFAVGAVAAYLPARRATAVSPMEALRQE